MKQTIDALRASRYLPKTEVGVPPSPFAVMQKKMHDFTRDRLPQHRADADKNARTRRVVPGKMLKELGQMGLSVFDVPTEHGGLGLSAVQMAELGMPLSYESAAHGLTTMIVHDTLTAGPLREAMNFAEPEQATVIKGLIKDIASGKKRGFFALTEPLHGTDATNLEMAATKINRKGVDGFLLNGDKQLITNTPGADFAIVATRTGTTEQGREGISVFLVNIKEANKQAKKKGEKPPFRITKIFDKGGQTPGAVLTEVQFDNLFVPKNAMLGRENKGWTDILSPTLGRSRIHIAAQAAAVGARAFDEAKLRTAERVQHKGETLDKKSRVRDQLTMMYRQTKLAEYMVRKAAQMYDSGDKNAMIWASLAKLVAGDTAYWAASGAQEFFGGIGYVTDYFVPHETRRGRDAAVAEPKEKMPIVDTLVNDAKPLRTYEGAANVLLELFVKPYFSPEDYAFLEQNVIAMQDFRTGHYSDRAHLGEILARVEKMIPLETRRKVEDIAPTYQQLTEMFAA